jgi:hypothetical protein
VKDDVNIDNESDLKSAPGDEVTVLVEVKFSPRAVSRGDRASPNTCLWEQTFPAPMFSLRTRLVA